MLLHERDTREDSKPYITFPAGPNNVGLWSQNNSIVEPDVSNQIVSLIYKHFIMKNLRPLEVKLLAQGHKPGKRQK